MEMNQKTAFKILGVGPGASLDQVKKAFRDLAKQYHPDCFSQDRFPTDEILPAPAEARLNRMKEINQAFHLLLPLLTPDALTDKASTDIPPSSKVKKAGASSDKDSGDKDISFLDMLLRLNKRFAFYRKPGNQPNPCVKPPLKSRKRQKSKVETTRFATILNTLHPAGTVDKKMGSGRYCRTLSQDSRDLSRSFEAHPYNRFLKYTALKKQIDARNRYSGEQNSSRIEKIGPVTRVNPIGNKHKP
jgi:curved DNA-binding protein CbpA